MQAPITSFNGWIISKILNYLLCNEGCITGKANYTGEGVRAEVTDAFGFRYEIQVKTIGRVLNLEEKAQ